MATFNQSNGVTLGTTPLIKVPKEENGAAVKPGEGYFRVRIHSAQAAVYGPFWQKTQQLVVVSEVKLNSQPFGSDPVRSLQRIRTLKRGVPEQLGLATNLISLIPAAMEQVTIAIEFLVDRENRFSQLADLANDGTFLAAISFAPGAVAVANSLAQVSKKIITMFMSVDDQQPVMRFEGDFSLPANDLSDAYYVILSAHHAKHPLPRPLPSPETLKVQNHELLYDNSPVTDWSYVILDVDTVKERTIDFGRGQPWYEKLDQADKQADEIYNDPWASETSRRSVWESCATLIRDADTLLTMDPSYSHKEARAIISRAYSDARKKVMSSAETALGAPPGLSAKERAFLDVTGEDELQLRIAQYNAAESRSREKLTRLGLL